MNIQVLEKLGLELVDLDPGTVLIREGETNHTVYVLLSGTLDLDAKGHRIAQVDSPGTILGEISALLGTEPVATVKTAERSSFYAITDFMTFIHEHPEACVSVAQVLACRLVNMNNHFVFMREQIQNLQNSLQDYVPVFPEKFAADSAAAG